MSVAEGVCDWCGVDHRMETGDERSIVQFNKLWCGVCREGSKARYENRSNDLLSAQIESLSAMLDQHPIQWEPPYDHPVMHLFKLGYYDEIWRMERELEFRNEETES